MTSEEKATREAEKRAKQSKDIEQAIQKHWRPIDIRKE